MSDENMTHWARLGSDVDFFIQTLNDRVDGIYTPAADDEDTQDTVTGITQEMLDEVIRPALRQMSEVASTIVGLYFRQRLTEQQNNQAQVVPHQPTQQVVQHPRQYGY